MFQALIGIFSFGYLFWLSYKMSRGYLRGYAIGREIAIEQENARRALRREAKDRVRARDKMQAQASLPKASVEIVTIDLVQEQQLRLVGRNY